MQSSRALVRTLGQTKGVVRSYHRPTTFKQPTMNDLPLPQGSWKDFDAARQAKYNKHLILGTGFFLVTLGTLSFSGILHLNFSPPERPADRE